MSNNILIVYLISSAFSTYTIYKFMCIFFERNEINRKIEIVSYILYYIFMSVIFITFNYPILNLITNIIIFFLLTLNYPATLKLRLTATVLIYVILAIVECFAVVAVKLLKLNSLVPHSDLEIISILVSSKIFSYIIVLALANFKMVKNSINVTTFHWVSILMIPIGTLVSTIMLILESNENNLLIITNSIIIMFFINIFVFYLYDQLMKTYHDKMEKELLQQQNNAYSKQFELINQSQENIKMLRHDIKNHMSSLQALIKANDNERALNYLKNIYDHGNYSNEYAKSGNSEIDSILNYKINEASKHGIKVNVSLNIPEKLSIQPFDLSVVLGNLIDNSIEATLKLSDDKTINVSIEYERNVLYISISNPYDGKLLYKNSKLKTTHHDKENHGIGLNSVKKSVDKYNGVLDIHYTDKIFYADVLIYNTKEAITIN